MTILIYTLIIIISCLIIWKASDGFEVASEYLGRNLSDGVKGATVNAIGSSMPEFFTTLFFLFVLDDKEGFSGGIGTSAGSAVFNGMIIPAFVILVVISNHIAPSISISKKVLLRDGIALLLCEAIFIYILGGNGLNWAHGLILMSLYLLYVLYMLSGLKKKHNNNNTNEHFYTPIPKGNILKNILTLNIESLCLKGKKITSRSAWVLLSISILIIGAGCMLLVSSCERLGEHMHIPIYFIAVIIASAATSVPDTILSIKDAKKGNYDDAVSNALGSNIFDICFALGFPLFLYTFIYGEIEMSTQVIENVTELNLLLFICTLLAFTVYISTDKLNKSSAITLLGIYVLFLCYILGKSMNIGFINQISVFLIQINTAINPLRFWM